MSDESKDFIRQCLHVDEGRRLAPEHLETHALLRQYFARPSGSSQYAATNAVSSGVGAVPAPAPATVKGIHQTQQVPISVTPSP